MKKIFFIVLIVLVSCKSKQEALTKQDVTIASKSKNPNHKELKEFQGDTLKYVQTKILDRKEYYIGKKFEVLLDDLDIPIKNIMFTPDFSNTKKVSYTYFEIYDGFETSRKLEKGEIPVNIIITWQPPLDANKLIIDRTKSGQWTPEKEAYFKQQIVGDVVRTNYNLENYKKK
ncbi:hypothetical protein [Flavobacterium sp. LM4]|uniref:hypothetical protein n=1 Tax=Flavobacterium sp. LM4 TaxID=1938609 RepID=UPI000F4D7BA0|nr:hypothetical protein [Flavobacterium sp. LM4]